MFVSLAQTFPLKSTLKCLIQFYTNAPTKIVIPPSLPKSSPLGLFHRSIWQQPSKLLRLQTLEFSLSPSHSSHLIRQKFPLVSTFKVDLQFIHLPLFPWIQTISISKPPSFLVQNIIRASYLDSWFQPFPSFNVYSQHKDPDKSQVRSYHSFSQNTHLQS